MNKYLPAKKTIKFALVKVYQRFQRFWNLKYNKLKSLGKKTRKC